MRRFSARQSICRCSIFRLRAASSTRSSNAVPTPRLCHARSMLNAASASPGRSSKRSSAYHPIYKKTVDDRLSERGQLGIALDELVGNRAAEAIAPTFGIEAQQMLTIKLGFAGPEPADTATRYQRLMHWVTQSYFTALRRARAWFGVGSKRQSRQARAAGGRSASAARRRE